MKIFDQKIKRNLTHYLCQCGLATLTICLILMLLDIFTQTTVIAALGASTFIVFAMPSSYPARPRPLIGGYLVGIATGSICHLLAGAAPLASVGDPYVWLGALAVGMAILGMVATDTEHPPAAGMALSLVLNEWEYSIIAFALVAVILLSVAKRLLQGFLIDLV